MLLSCSAPEHAEQHLPPMPVIPSDKQVTYQQMEVIGFIHFGVNTFTDREWGTGKEDPLIFNPALLDATQWVEAAETAGMGMLILTAKHHDGFCLWPSEYTEHSVKGSPWENGQGDVVRMLSEACARAGIKFGIYLSPWDMHEPSYGSDDYDNYYLSQLKELLTGYGTISEVWMDGAKGENAKDMEYDFNAYRSLVYALQPQALIFSDVGPDIRWIGNEHGIAGITNWSTINTEGLEIGKADTEYLNTGDPDGTTWLVGECDVSIRPGWFYHASQDTLVKSPEYLVDLYYKSVGRNGTLLLNLPPDQRGLIHSNDIQSLKEFRDILDETFKHNLFREGNAIASGQWSKNPGFDPQNLLDEDPDSYWAADPADADPWITVELKEKLTFDRLMLQEPIRLGQRISEFIIEAEKEGEWKTISTGTTIGYKRLLRIDPVTVRKLRIKITGYTGTPALSTMAGYNASSREKIF
ncbi:MAG: alpha-L-fucosidase [Cyclobacteriaceae bacterium]|nr:alpha-L-fucosidase [Cyclobacteriaceae bacterium]